MEFNHEYFSSVSLDQFRSLQCHGNILVSSLLVVRKSVKENNLAIYHLPALGDDKVEMEVVGWVGAVKHAGLKEQLQDYEVTSRPECWMVLHESLNVHHSM